MSKYQIIAGRQMYCKCCKNRVALLMPMPVAELVIIGNEFVLAHSGCTAKMKIKEQNRRRYRLHRQCREAGLTVIAKDRDVQGFDETNLPIPAKRLLNEFQYNFQYTI